MTKHPKVLLSSFTLEDGFDNDTISILYGIDTILNSTAITTSEIVGSTSIHFEKQNTVPYYD